MSDLELTGIDHVGVPTWNADTAGTFLDGLGLDCVLDETVPEYNVRAVFYDLDGIYVEFLEPTGPGGVKTFLERRGPGYQHVAYRTPDLDEAVAVLRADGVTFQSNEPLPGVGDARIIFVEERHTDGLQTELVERD